MFKLQPNPTFPLKVKITVAGQETPGQLDLVAKHKGRKELKAWQERAAKSEDPQFLDEIISGWSVVDEAGQPVPYTVDALAQLLDTYPMSGFEIYEAYLRELTESRRKN